MIDGLLSGLQKSGLFTRISSGEIIIPNQTSSTGDLKVSARGQMSLPAAARRRWGLADGGDVGFIDLGDALLIVPGNVDALRQEMLGAIGPERWQEAQTGFGDPELATE